MEPSTQDLSGLWRVAPVTPDLERRGTAPTLDDGSWLGIGVPGHWGQVPDLADLDGPVIYRRRFAAPVPTADERVWLRFDGVLSEARIWLDGQPVGRSDVYFASGRHEVTEVLRRPAGAGGPVADGHDHVVAVEVACPPPEADGGHPSTGSLQSGPLAPPGSPGGIWRAVALDTTGPVAIVSASLLCLSADADQARLRFWVTLDADRAGPVRLDTSIVGPDGRTAGGATVHQVSPGRNRIGWTVSIERPALWWPRSMGAQPRYDVGLAVRVGDGNQLSDRRHWRTGLRRAAVDRLTWSVNGRRLFVKGIVVGPHDRFLAAVPAAQFADDVRSAAEAGLDLVRVHGHVTRPELYDAADDLGVLVWQDLPLVGPFGGTRAQARRVARAAVDELGHHPSIVVWCGHDEPNGAPLPHVEGPVDPVGRLGRRLGRHLLPSWNRSVLDPLVRRELRAADPTRSIITRSGSLPVGPSGSDSHLWLGWRAGRPEDLVDMLRHWPRLGAFLGALGAQSVSVRDWDPDEPTWATAERGSFERYVPRTAYGDGPTWAQATRAYQAEVIRTQIETVRRLKYRPSGGFCVVALFDAEGSGGFGVLDRLRRPKPALDALVDSCRPVVVVADTPPPISTPGQVLELAVHAISDLRTTLASVTVTARAWLGPWETTRRWRGDLEADGCSWIGDLRIEVPPITGSLVVDLVLEADDRTVSNRYQTVVIPPSEATDGWIAEPRGN